MYLVGVFLIPSLGIKSRSINPARVSRSRAGYLRGNQDDINVRLFALPTLGRRCRFPGAAELAAGGLAGWFRWEAGLDVGCDYRQ